MLEHRGAGHLVLQLFQLCFFHIRLHVPCRAPFLSDSRPELSGQNRMPRRARRARARPASRRYVPGCRRAAGRGAASLAGRSAQAARQSSRQVLGDALPRPRSPAPTSISISACGAIRPTSAATLAQWIEVARVAVHARSGRTALCLVIGINLVRDDEGCGRRLANAAGSPVCVRPIAGSPQTWSPSFFRTTPAVRVTGWTPERVKTPLWGFSSANSPARRATPITLPADLAAALRRAGG